MNVYKYMYFGLYKLLLKTSAKDVAETIAAVWLAVLIGMNFIFFVKYFGFEVREYLDLRTYFSLVYGVSLLINLYLFIWKKKYRIIIEYYIVETKNKKNIRRIFTVSYIILTFLTLILLSSA